VKEPLPECRNILKAITSNTNRLSRIISEGFVTRLGKLKIQCSCDRHSNINQIAEEALESISESAATAYGLYEMRPLLKSHLLDIAVSLPYLKM